MSQITIQPDSLSCKRTSGEYILVVKNITKKDGKYEYLLMDADRHEYYVLADELYPEGKMLRCMVKLEVKKGRLLVKKVNICRGQNLISQTSEQLPTQTVKKKNKHRKRKETVKDVNPSQIDPSDRAVIVEDVKRLIEARESGQTNSQLKSEVTRLYQKIVDDHLQDIVIEECGEESLRKVFTMARSLRRAVKKKEDKQSLSSKGDSDYKKLDNTLRNKWLEWFKRKFGSVVKNKTEKQLFDALGKAANYLNFVELQEACISEVQFYQNGLGHCFQIAKNLNLIKFKPSTPKKGSTPPKRKKTQNSYLTSGSPHVTKKDWGSAYKPARG